MIATVDVYALEGTVVARGADFFGAADAVVRLLLVPEPSSAGLIALALALLAVSRRR